MTPACPTRNPAKAILALAAANEGIVTTKQLLDRELSYHALRRLEEQGVVLRELHGIYRVAGTRQTETQRRLIATLGTGGALSHQSAARYWGWSGSSETPIHMMVARNRGGTGADWIVLHHVRRDLKDQCAAVGGLTVVRPLWTLLDVAAAGTKRVDLKSFQDCCLARRVFTWSRLVSFVAKQPPRTPGLSRLRELLAESLDVDSVAEALLHDALRSSGIPMPVSQFRLRDADGRIVAVLDNAWPESRVGLEMDGYGPHSAHEAFVSDRERHNSVIAEGWILMHTTPAAVRRNAGEVVGKVKRVLARAQANLAAG